MTEPVRYVLLSDLHLGDRDSVLTATTQGDEVDPTRPGAVLVEVVACLRYLLAEQPDRPTLIINGDFLDLAFGSLSNALMMFERFAELTLAPGQELFDGILYLPGNHDHHVWEMAREAAYRDRVVRYHHAEGMPSPPHATSLRPQDAIGAPALEMMLQHLHGEAADRPFVRVVYPNMALVNEQQDRCVVVHHGHYVEPVYSLFSRGRKLLFPERTPALSVEQIEQENFAWIDFVWSLLGRSGAAGEDAETLFEMLRYPARTRAFAADLATRAAPHVRMPFLPWPWMRRLVLRHVLSRVASRLAGERAHLNEVCTPTTMRGIHEYLFGPMWQQVQRELGTIPDEITLLFGHTHKPFESVLEHPGDGRGVAVINSGGWTVDTDAGSPAFGASIVLVSERLDVASVRVYNDGPRACEVPLEVRLARAGGFQGRRVSGSDGGFAAGLARRLQSMAGTESSRRLTGAIHTAVGERRMRHRQRFGTPTRAGRTPATRKDTK